MTKLLNAYRAAPTFINALKLREYSRRHPMAACGLSRVDADMIADAIHQSNRGPQIIFEHIG